MAKLRAKPQKKARAAPRKAAKSAKPIIARRSARNIRWIERHLRVPEGAFVGQPIRLRGFQREVIEGIYDTPTRTAIISFGRKNAKTTLAAMLLLLHLAGPEARQNSQLDSAALSRDQSSLIFNAAAKMVRMSRELSEVIRIRDTVKNLVCPELGIVYRALSADASTNLGLSPALTIHDELGQVRGPHSELYSALETAAGAQEEPLSIIISTQAPNDGDLLSILIDDALSGADPTIKVFLWTADESLDPFSEEAQRAANPAFGDFLNPKELRVQAEKARRLKSQEADYRNFVLNQRISPHSTLIPRSVWAACAGEVDETVFGREEVWCGLDLSSRNDLTALVLLAMDRRSGIWHSRCYFWSPLDTLRERSRRDRARYDVWAGQGLITATSGATIDYDMVAEALCDVCDDCKVVAIAFDRFRIDVIRAALKRLGRELPLIEYGQGFKDMSVGVDAIEEICSNGKLRHGGHPVLQYCAQNSIVITDPAGNRKLDKRKSTGRIDGMVALAMAAGQAAKANKGDVKGPSVYETRGILTI